MSTTAILTFDDIVSSFAGGQTTAPDSAATTRAIDGADEPRRLVRTAGVLVASIALLAVADFWLVRAEAAETSADAARLFGEGRASRHEAIQARPSDATAAP